MPAIDRYRFNLDNPRPPGTGCHGWIMSTANLGIIGGLPGEQIFTDIRRAIPPGTRKITDGEILTAIQKAMTDHQGQDQEPE